MEDLHRGELALTDARDRKQGEAVNLYWIDDEKKVSIAEAKNLEDKNPLLRTQVFDPEEFERKLLNESPSPADVDLFVVDFRLNRTPINSKRYAWLGISMASFIREKYPEHPIYGMSRAIEDDEMTTTLAFAIENIFERVIDFESIRTEGHETLYQDALDFRRARKNKKVKLDSLFDLLEAPPSSRKRLHNAVPTRIKEGLSRRVDKKSLNSLYFCRWVYRTLLSNPGFLYDSLHTATYLGIKPKALTQSRIAQGLANAKYKGVFCRKNHPLWWVSEIDTFLSKKMKSVDSSGMAAPWRTAPAVLGIPKNLLSICAVCGEPSPETVGLDTKPPHEQKPVHYHCSESDPNIKGEPFFDEHRILKR